MSRAGIMRAADQGGGAGGSSEQQINIAVLSTAHTHTKGFLESLAKGEDGRRIYAIWDDVTDRGKQFAEQFHAPFNPDLDSILADPAVDGFIITAENTRHLPLLKKAIPVGKPVFCEKPLVANSKELAEVEALLKQYDTPLFCGYFLPFSGTMQRVQQLVNEKAFGKVFRVRFRNAHFAALGRWFDDPAVHWFTEPELSGGGAFMDMGTHAVHLVLRLFGPVDRVWAEIRNESGVYPDADDFGVAHFEFSSGVLGTVEAGWTQLHGPEGLEIAGSEAALWHDGNQQVYAKAGEDPQPIGEATPQPTRVDRLIAVIQGKVSKEELAQDLAAIKNAVRVMEASYAAEKDGHWVSLA